jgi:hypothetical protein
MPEFREFLINCGDSAFRDIQHEFSLAKEKYDSKKQEKVYYEQLADAIDLSAIENSYHAIKHQSGALDTKSSAPDVEPIPTTLLKP